MSAEEVEAYLRERIPLSTAMGVRVKSATVDSVRLAAPLAPNVNHHETVFGGSASAVATLAAWTLLHLRLQAARGAKRPESPDGGPEKPGSGRSWDTVQLVIQRGAMEYRKPIPGDFDAVCEFSDAAAWERFSDTYARRGRARLTLRSRLVFDDHDMASFEGDFVALRRGWKRC
jgi:acyl-coenzyme A thioesterase PaaI-like protein